MHDCGQYASSIEDAYACKRRLGNAGCAGVVQKIDQTRKARFMIWVRCLDNIRDNCISKLIRRSKLACLFVAGSMEVNN